MHIGIFAERFIGRYGADRVCVILAEMFQQCGHQVTLVGVRFSRAVLERFPGQTVRVPDYTGWAPEPRTLKLLRSSRYYFRRHLPEFDACIVGGYPFVTAIPYLRTLTPQVIFLDFGVVPTAGYSPSLARLINSVRTNRRKCLRHATHIVAISDFIAEDQSRPDCDNRVPVSTVLLGADHLVRNIGYTEQGLAAEGPSYTQTKLAELKAKGRRLVLVLGRWEPGCYKNSQAAYEVLRSLLHYEPQVELLVMADHHYFQAEPPVRSNVSCIGLPSDADLLELVRNVDAGISMSLWEGFNLPVVELQHLGKQVFAFNLAAHPEVVVSPDQLCAGPEDMAVKLYDALTAEGGPAWAEPRTLGSWRERFSWQRFLKDFQRVVERAA
jgi:glycosyltransferase involved in cell wall biosynthesis